jgi:transposase
MCQYVRGADRDQEMLLPARVDDYIDPESPVRVLDAFVDGVELGALGFAQRGHGSRGRSSYDPASLLKLYLWGYLRRCRSSRKLEEACATNLEAIWLTGGIRPDHSTISDFRKRHPRPLKGIFKEFNLACIELGLFGRELVAIDGTFIKAVNSESKSFTRNKLAKLIASIDRATGRYLEMLDSADASEPQVGAGGGEEIRDKIERLKARKLQLEAYQEGCTRAAAM